MTSSPSLADVARRYCASLAGGAGPDPAIFAATVSLWWNIRPEGATIEGPAFAAALSAGHPPASMPDYRLDVESCRFWDGGFIVALAVRGTASDGVAAEANVCQIVTVVDGRITAWEEYLDTAQHQPFHP